MSVLSYQLASENPRWGYPCWQLACLLCPRVLCRQTLPAVGRNHVANLSCVIRPSMVAVASVLSMCRLFPCHRSLNQRPLTFWAPGASFVEDSFSMDRVEWLGVGEGWVMRAHHLDPSHGSHRAHAPGGPHASPGLPGGRAQAVMPAMGRGCKYR